MRQLPAALQAALASGVTTLCRCWKLTTGDGASLGFTDHDRDLSFEGVNYRATTGFSASDMQSSLGLNVDNLDVAGALSSLALTEEDLLAGRYDNADVEIWAVDWTDPDQRLLLKSGNLGEVKRGDVGFSAEIRGLAQRLNVTKGRNFQYGCDAILGDARCGVNLADPAFAATGAVVSSEAAWRLRVSGLEAFQNGWFRNGLITWSSGANAGRHSEVKAHRIDAAGVVIELQQVLPVAVVAGDGFAVVAGCDKQFSTCRDKFANSVNFRGFPHMPGNDFVVRYPNSTDSGNDGGSLAGGQ
jgi:uncharacterized phage protein (TIGR02218 family)